MKLSKNKKILIIISLTLLILITTLLIIFLNINKEKIILSDTLQFEINSKVPILSLIKTKENVEIINENELIDTSKLGEKDITIKYYNTKKQEKNLSFKVTIIDTTPPLIEGEDAITTTVGSKPDLLKNVIVTDNSNENITATIEGEYDYNKIGEYSLKYIAVDMSGNKTEKDFALKVESATIKTTGYYVYKKTDSWYAMQFGKNGKVNYLVNNCPYSACGGYTADGTYKVENNILTAIMTHQTTDIGEKEKLDKPVTWKFEIITEDKIIIEGKTYNYQKYFN
ncbi:MAG: DUF5011 domain-containing protein [Clostridium sp.]|nr:DUF5011 domain-containing protein [Clostridium sp.]MCM1444108.1 DUF5011 domain-containing protein [Candidatus Amulumruptor caecigallinarius]